MKLFSGLTLFFLCSCAANRVIVEKDKYGDFNLEEYSTFDFAQITLPNDDLVAYSQIVKLLKEEIADELEARELELDTLNPDLLINLGLVVADKVQTREGNVTSDPFTYSGQRNYDLEIRKIPVNTYREGSLTVHFVETSGKVLVWVGSISEVVSKDHQDEKKSVQNAVDLLFKSFDIHSK